MSVLPDQPVSRPKLGRIGWPASVLRSLQNLSAKAIEQGSHSSGLTYAELGIRLSPTDTVCLFNRALALQHLGRLVEAADAYSNLISAMPHDREALLQRAEVFGDLGRWQEAIADYTAALHLLPDDADALLNRGAAFAELRRWPEAEADFRSVLSISPNDQEAIRNLERVHRRLAGVRDVGPQGVSTALSHQEA